MFAWIYWSGYIVSFLFVFISTIVSLHHKVAEGTISESTVVDEYAGMILIAVFCSFLSWAWFLFYAGLIIIGTGKNVEPPTIARAR